MANKYLLLPWRFFVNIKDKNIFVGDPHREDGRFFCVIYALIMQFDSYSQYSNQ